MDTWPHRTSAALLGWAALVLSSGSLRAQLHPVTNQGAITVIGQPGLGQSPAGSLYRVSWATNALVAIEAAASLSFPEWSPVATNHLVAGWAEFRDPATWMDHPHRFYRLRLLDWRPGIVMWGDSMVAVGGLNTALAGRVAPRAFRGVSYPGATSYQILARLQQEVQGANSFGGWLHVFFHGTNNLNDSDQVRSAALAMAELAGAPDNPVIWLSVIGQLDMSWNGSRLMSIQHESAFQGWGGIWELEQWYETHFPGSLLNCRRALIDGAPSIPSLHFPGLTEAQAAATYGVLPLSFYMDMATKPWTPAALTFRGYWSQAGLPSGGTDGDYWLRTGHGRIGAVLARWGGTWTEHTYDWTHLNPAGNAVLARALAQFLSDRSL